MSISTSHIPHRMQLQPLPFGQIQAGAKRIEIRLFDEKRRAMKIGDMVEFYHAQNNDQICIKKIIAITQAASLLSLFQAVSLTAAGWPEGTTSEKAASDMRKYYSIEEEMRWGAVALHLSAPDHDI